MAVRGTALTVACMLVLATAVLGAHLRPAAKPLAYRAHRVLRQAEPYSVPWADAAIDVSAAAYCPADKLSAWNCLTCKDMPGINSTTVVYDAPTDTQAFVAWDNERESIWVVFRGTDPLSIQDWIDDLNFLKTTKIEWTKCGSDCAVHEGFYDSYMTLRDGIHKAVSDLMSMHPGAPLLVSGHSLGAALSELGALDLWESYGVAPQLVYNFGCPRVGNDAWRKYYNAHIPINYRVTHYADPVPHLPPYAFGFHHTANEIWYNELETDYTVCDGSGEDPHCADSILFPFLVTDHLTYMGLNFSANFIECKL